MGTSLRQVNTLVVGGGAAARIVGRALANAGTEVALLLKPEFAAVADQGFELHRLITFKKKRERQRFDDFRILTSVDDLSHNHFDQIYICVSGPDLRTGWLEKAWQHLQHSIWVSFQPGVDDREYLRQIIPDRYLVMGSLGFIAYHAPLPSENIFPPGVAYWYPPTQMTMVAASDEKLTTLVLNLLQRGGLPTGTTTGFEAYRLHRSAAVVPVAASLEIHGWDFDRLREDKGAIARLCVAMAEVGEAVYASTGRNDSLNGRLRKPWFWRLLLKYLDAFTPMPLAEYMQRHFTKLRPQTEKQLEGFIRMTKAAGREPTALTAIAKQWVRTRPPVSKERHDSLATDGMVASTRERSEFSRTGAIGGQARGRSAEENRRGGRPVGNETPLPGTLPGTPQNPGPNAQYASGSGPHQQPSQSGPQQPFQSGQHQQPQQFQGGQHQQGGPQQPYQSGQHQQPQQFQSGQHQQSGPQQPYQSGQHQQPQQYQSGQPQQPQPPQHGGGEQPPEGGGRGDQFPSGNTQYGQPNRATNPLGYENPDGEPANPDNHTVRGFPIRPANSEDPDR